jgi:hypothetical protein
VCRRHRATTSGHVTEIHCVGLRSSTCVVGGRSWIHSWTPSDLAVAGTPPSSSSSPTALVGMSLSPVWLRQSRTSSSLCVCRTRRAVSVDVGCRRLLSCRRRADRQGALFKFVTLKLPLRNQPMPKFIADSEVRYMFPICVHGNTESISHRISPRTTSCSWRLRPSLRCAADC